MIAHQNTNEGPTDGRSPSAAVVISTTGSCLNRWTLQDHPMVCIPYGGLDWAKAFRCDGLPGYCADCLPSI
ncbi:hypothetical protein ACLKA6_014599 [Drosophila palustris]